MLKQNFVCYIICLLHQANIPFPPRCFTVLLYQHLQWVVMPITSKQSNPKIHYWGVYSLQMALRHWVNSFIVGRVAGSFDHANVTRFARASGINPFTFGRGPSQMECFSVSLESAGKGTLPFRIYFLGFVFRHKCLQM